MSPRSNAFAAGPLMAEVRPAGPTVEKFILDFDHRVCGIMGPVGGGKTTGCIQKVDVIAAVQPICHDGVIRARGVVVRDSFRTLEKTVLRSWFEWFPKEMRDPLTGADMWDFSGGNDRPAVHRRRWKSERGIIESEVEFVGIGSHRIEDITRGSEWTWAWVNEWDLVTADTIDAIDQRLPRYPPKRLLADRNAEVIPFLIGDFNAPDIENWTYQRFVENPIPGYKLYTQPGGMEPNAENKHNLGAGYYENMLATKEDWWCNRFVHNRFGYSRYGKPVYPEVNEGKHFAATELAPMKGLPLRVGVDAGGRPAAIVAQRLPNGQVRWLDEVTSQPYTGPKHFAAVLIAILLSPKYQGCDVELLIGDPSAAYGADTESGELAWLDTVGRAIGVPWQPHWTNEPAMRQAAIRELLTHDIDGRIPGLLVSPTCRRARAGLAHGYHFEHEAKDPSKPLKLRPEKNEYSHPVEAGEYVTGSWTDRQALIDRAAHVRPGNPLLQRRVAPRARPGEFDVFRV